jgi:hypothetical protein
MYTISSYCNKCGQETNHKVLSSEETKPKGSFEYRWEIIKCCGCGEVSFRRTQTGRYSKPRITYYPPRIARRVPDWLAVEWAISEKEFVPIVIHQLLNEIYTALYNNSKSLVAMGVRAVLEAIMIDKIGDQGNFKYNLDEFQKAHYISLRQRTVLDTIMTPEVRRLIEVGSQLRMS